MMTTPPRLTAITGGIGAGKSIVSRTLRILGYEVFDCDTQARDIMDRDHDIKSLLVDLIHPMAVSPQGVIDRKLISSVVFADPEKLHCLNSIVHTAVKQRIDRWHRDTPHRRDRIFVETAILYQSGLDRLVDDVIEITAPLDIRISRVIARNGSSRQEVLARIQSQDTSLFTPHSSTSLIINDDLTPVLPQILRLLA